MEKTLPKLIDEYEVDLLLFLGDLTEDKHGHEAELVNRVARVFHELSELCPIIALQGNHDWLSSPANPFFGFLSRIGAERITWVSAPTPLASLKTASEKLCKALQAILLPHSANCERDWGAIDFGGYKTAFAHQSFAGARSEGGFELGGVPLSYFPSRLKIVSGDIHRPQTVANLTYVGSPYHVDFGDSFEGRVLIYDGNWHSIPVEGPQKRLIEISSLEDLDDFVIPQGDILKVRVSLTNYDEWPELQAGIEVWAKENRMVLNQTQPIIQNPLTKKASLEKRASKTDKELFEEYGQKRQLTEGVLKAGEKFL